MGYRMTTWHSWLRWQSSKTLMARTVHCCSWATNWHGLHSDFSERESWVMQTLSYWRNGVTLLRSGNVTELSSWPRVFSQQPFRSRLGDLWSSGFAQQPRRPTSYEHIGV